MVISNACQYFQKYFHPRFNKNYYLKERKSRGILIPRMTVMIFCRGNLIALFIKFRKKIWTRKNIENLISGVDDFF